MRYEMTDYQGQKISLSAEQAHKMAGVAGLIEITVGSRVHYVNPKNIASIKPLSGPDEIDKSQPRLAAPDHRGEISPALEKIRERWSKS